MTYFLLTSCVVLLYGVVALGAYGQQALGRWRRLGLALLTLLALLGHAYLLQQGIDLPQGQNLNVANLFSLIAWLAGFILFLGQCSLPITSLGLLVYPIAAFSLLLSLHATNRFIVVTSEHPWALFHILWSTLVVGLFVISGCQALLLALQERLLRAKKLTGFLERLPPLQVMETVLFNCIKWGVLTLSLLLLSSFLLFKRSHLPGVWSKMLLGIAVWSVFIVLLLGRHFLGWRGNLAVAWTVSGVILSVGVYLGSHFLLLI